MVQRASGVLMILALALGVAQRTAPGADPPVNSGRPGAGCRAESRVGYTLPPPTSRPNAFGRGAPAYSELGLPSRRARGIMLMTVTGGWYLVGPQVVSASRDVADGFRRMGWIVLSSTTRGCTRSVSDALWFHDALRRRFGPRLPFCTSGASAGGHVALMVAARRPDVACAIALGAPTDLPALGSGSAFDAADPAHTQGRGPRWIKGLAIAAFGARHLAANSPRRHAAGIAARLLLATAAVDPFIPRDQATRLRNAVRSHDPQHYVDVIVLPAPTAGDRVEFCHGGTTRAGAERFRARQDALLDRVTGRRTARPANRPIACPPPWTDYEP